MNNGIPGIGYANFMKAADDINGSLDAKSLSVALWGMARQLLCEAGYDSASDVETHLQRIVNVFSQGHIYEDAANIVDQNGNRHAVLSAKPENKNKSAIEISKLVLAERMDLQMRKELYEKVHGRAYDGGDL